MAGILETHNEKLPKKNSHQTIVYIRLEHIIIISVWIYYVIQFAMNLNVNNVTFSLEYEKIMPETNLITFFIQIQFMLIQ